MNSLRVSSGCRAAVSAESRAPPDPPAMTIGPRSRAVISRPSVSARMCDSVGPQNWTSDRPQFGRSHTGPRGPPPASASAGRREPARVLLTRPPGVSTSDGPSAGPSSSYSTRPPLISMDATVPPSGRHDDVVALDPHRVGADAPLRLHRGGAGGQLETPLVPGAVDPLAVLDGGRATGGGLVDHRPAGHPARAQRAALVRAVVGDRPERAGDVVDADAVPP